MFERYLQGAINVIKPSEPLSEEFIEDLYSAFESISESGLTNVVLDLSNTPLATGAGFDAILDARDHYVARGGDLKLAAPGPLIHDQLRVTKVADQFEVFDSVAVAVGSFV